MLSILLWLSGGLSLADDASRCVACHQGLSDRLSKSVTRWQKSAHALASVGCSECHGGDPKAVRGGPEHAGFPGHPSPSEIASFCGRCHSEALADYRRSGHSKLRDRKPVLGCVECHGAHDVGNPPPLFRLSEYCRSCHGLEYLLPLPADLTLLLEAGDRLTDSLTRRFDKPLPAAERDQATMLQKEVGKFLHAGSLEISRQEVTDWIRRMDEVSGRLKKQE